MSSQRVTTQGRRSTIAKRSSYPCSNVILLTTANINCQAFLQLYASSITFSNQVTKGPAHLTVPFSIFTTADNLCAALHHAGFNKGKQGTGLGHVPSDLGFGDVVLVLVYGHCCIDAYYVTHTHHFIRD